MLVLTQTTDTIEVILGASHTTNPVRCAAFWRGGSGGVFDADRNVADSNGTNAVTLVSAPSSSNRRIIYYLSFFNDDTVNQTVTVRFNANGTIYKLQSITLAPGEKLDYCDGNGFRVFSNSGSIKQTYSSGTNPVSSSLQITVLGSDVVNNNGTANTIADVTGLSFAVTAGNRYKFRFVIRYSAAATTTGSRWSVNGPGSPTELTYRAEYSLTTTSSTVIEGSTAYDLPAASNASSAATGGNIAIVEGIIQPSANGTVIARFASEVSSSAITAEAGSFVEYQQV